MHFYRNSRSAWYIVHPWAARPEQRSDLRRKLKTSRQGLKSTPDLGSRRGYNHSWRPCLTRADHRPSLQKAGGWGGGTHKPELEREEHLLRFSSPHLSNSTVPFSRPSAGVICPGFPFAIKDADLLLYSGRLNTQHNSLAFVTSPFSASIFLFLLAGVCFFFPQACWFCSSLPSFGVLFLTVLWDPNKLIYVHLLGWMMSAEGSTSSHIIYKSFS